MERAGLDRADLVVVFFTVDHAPAWQKLSAALGRVARTGEIVGSSGAGVLTIDGEIEGGPGVAVLVFAAEEISAGPFLHHPLGARASEVGAALARSSGAGNSLLVAFPDSYNFEPRGFFHGLEEGGFVPLVGAGSSENGAAGKTFQLSREGLTTNSLSGFSLAGALDVSIDITQGCQPIGAEMTITKCEGNFILEIDHRPAFESFARVVKGPLLDDLGRALAYVFAGLPAEPEKNRVGAGEYLVRNIVGLDPERGILAVAEEVIEGERMLFTLRDPDRAREDLGQMLERQAGSLGGKRPALGFYFNCCARGRSLYKMDGIDAAYIRRALGDFPLIGLFGGFELAPLGKKNHLFAYTGVLALVAEK
jgi:small ligand-binding sensory domain FIST